VTFSLFLVAVEDAMGEQGIPDYEAAQDESENQNDETQIQKSEVQTQSVKSQQTQINILPPGTKPKRGHG